MTDITTNLHEALSVYGLVSETLPLIACSNDYRQRFRDAIRRAFGEYEPDNLKSVIKDLRADIETLEEHCDGYRSDYDDARIEVKDLEANVIQRDKLIAELRQKLEDATATQPGAAE